MTWHLNCTECGANGSASGRMGEEAVRFVAQAHADGTDHIVRVWPRGDQDSAVLVYPAVIATLEETDEGG